MAQVEGGRPVIKIYGASDDLIELEGDVTEEFPFADKGEGGDLLAFSNGTVLRIDYTDPGVWRITPVIHGVGRFVLTQCPEDDDNNYSDIAEIHDADITWVVHGIALAGPPGARVR